MNHLFEYAVIRVVPRVERGEFLNAGVVLFCKKTNFLQLKMQLDAARLQALCPCAEVEDILQHLNAFEQICHATTQTSSIATLDAPSRFRWLTAKRSTVVQTSVVHPGITNDPELKLQQLFEQLVLQ